MPIKNNSVTLHVPLDASGIKDFKPDEDIKVLAVGKDGSREERVRLGKDGKGAVSFTFERQPGGIRVVVGPGNATAQELQDLQSISVSVSAGAWRGKDTLSI